LSFLNLEREKILQKKNDYYSQDNRKGKKPMQNKVYKIKSNVLKPDVGATSKMQC
jgi:hypothetical protein